MQGNSMTLAVGERLPDATLVRMGEKMGEDVEAKWREQIEQIRDDEIPASSNPSG